MKMTEAQHRRQRHRAENGRYGAVNPCEECGRSAGDDYVSLPDCNETGIGVVLCQKCAEKKMLE